MLLPLVLTLATLEPAQAGEGTVKFFWCAQVASGTSKDRTFRLPGEEVLHLKAGDGIQFYFSPVTRSFVYLLHLRPDQTVVQLLPKPGTTSVVDPGTDHYLPGPARSEWYVLDTQVGRELMYLIVSAQRPEALDAALRANAAATGAARTKTAAAVLAEIAALRAQEPPVLATARPTTIAGTFRGADVDPAAHATGMTASKVFVRSYVIEHK